MLHVGQGHYHGLEEAEDRRPLQETGLPFGRIDQHAEINYVISVESRGMTYVDGSFQYDRVWQPNPFEKRTIFNAGAPSPR
jgi:hypothetical protein